MSQRLLRYGERAWLIELADGEVRRAWQAALSGLLGAADRPATLLPIAGVVDVVPAARTVLVVFDSESSCRAAEPGLQALEIDDFSRGVLRAAVAEGSPLDDPRARVIDIAVSYDGVDLAQVGRLLGLEPEEVAAQHREQRWFVDFMGFLPGFAYLLPEGTDRPLQIPRRDNPRIAVPPGSVGLADEFTGVYPQASPGGWRLIGRTNTRLWDQHRDPPALLSPGARVRFIDADGSRQPEVSSPPVSSTAVPLGPAAFTVLATVTPLLIEDLGRPGQAHLAVSTGGAADRGALRRGNRLLGNPEGAAGLELLTGGARLRSETDQWVCVSGAPGPVAVEARPVAHDEPFRLRAGQELEVGRSAFGLRRYLCRRGGVGGHAVLGSLSTDPVSGVGPPALNAGDALVGADVEPTGELSSGIAVHEPASGRPFTVHPGPRADWFADGIDALTAAVWTVTSELNRVGLRLTGPRLPAAHHRQLPSEGVLRGAVQVPPNGQPTIFGPDHPTTGGYPVMACLAEAELDRFSQLRPGDVVAFRRSLPLARSVSTGL